jgi:chromosome segregation ATPase
MSDVKRRYTRIWSLHSSPAYGGLGNVEVVNATDYDALAQQLAASQAREADLIKDLKVIDGEHGCACRELAEAQAAITRLETAHETRLQEILNEVSAMEKRQAALQGLLNERDQQVDDAVGLLRSVGQIVRRRCSWLNPIVDDLLRNVDAFLSPAEDKANDH